MLPRGPVVACLCAAAAALAGPAAAQAPPIGPTDTVEVVASREYTAGRLHRLLLGGGYRTTWATPVRVPVLRISEYAGGLEAVDVGGGAQTSSLRLVGPQGREYNFRSVDKSYDDALPEWLRGTVVHWLRADQTGAMHPGAALVASPLLDSVGVLNPGPRLVVLADDPALGEYREEFAGMLGTVEIHPNEGEDDEPFWFGSETIAGGDRVLEHLAEEPEHRVDAPAFLAERLMSVYLNDWDRHIGQYRFARYRRDDGGYRWVPIPEDRDYALVDFEGWILRGARSTSAEWLVAFGPELPPVGAMTWSSRDLTRELLAPLDRATWDSVAHAVLSRLTDQAIDQAVGSLPDAWAARDADRLAAVLRARRDEFPAMSDRFYRRLAAVPEIRATDQPDVAEVARHAGGDVTVRLRAPGNQVLGHRPYFERRFRADETREIRLFLRAGDDSLAIRGPRGPIRVRVVGGEGEDVLADSSGGAVLYDARGENRFVTGPGTRADRRRYEPPTRDSPFAGPIRDRGGEATLFSPAFGWRPDAGLLVGGGPRWTRYGFRHHPFESRHGLAALVAPGPWRGLVRYRGALHPESSPAGLELEAEASNVDVLRFHGLGNASPSVPDDAAVSWVRRYSAAARWRTPVPGGLELAVGPVVRWSEPELEAGSPLRARLPSGARGAGEAGLAVELAWDGRDDGHFPRRGLRADLELGGFLPLRDSRAGFGVGRGTLVTFVPLPGIPLIAALRAGGAVAAGEVPVYAAPAIGGRNDLRGFPEDRFRGDVAAFGTAELRLPLVPANPGVRGTVGVSAFGDAGRVWLDGASPGGWHTAPGGSIWFSTPAGSVAVEYAAGEKRAVYLRLGLGLGDRDG